MQTSQRTEHSFQACPCPACVKYRAYRAQAIFNGGADYYMPVPSSAPSSEPAEPCSDVSTSAVQVSSCSRDWEVDDGADTGELHGT